MIVIPITNRFIKYFDFRVEKGWFIKKYFFEVDEFFEEYQCQNSEELDDSFLICCFDLETKNIYETPKHLASNKDYLMCACWKDPNNEFLNEIGFKALFQEYYQELLFKISDFIRLELLTNLEPNTLAHELIQDEWVFEVEYLSVDIDEEDGLNTEIEFNCLGRLNENKQTWESNDWVMFEVSKEEEGFDLSKSCFIASNKKHKIKNIEINFEAMKKEFQLKQKETSSEWVNENILKSFIVSWFEENPNYSIHKCVSDAITFFEEQLRLVPNTEEYYDFNHWMHLKLNELLA